MARTSEWGRFEWGAAEWGSTDVGGLTPGTGSLALSGAAPALLPAMIEPPTGSLTLAGVAASLGASAAIQPPAGQLVLVGSAPPTLRLTVAGALTLLGLAPSLIETFVFALTWDTDASLLSRLQLDWEVGAAAPIVGGTLPLEWSLDELLARLRLDWTIYQVGLEAAYEDDPQRPWAQVTAS
jgi:hypothetical protein